MRGVPPHSEAIRRRRKARAMTQEDLAAVCGCSTRTVSNAECGKPMDTVTLALIAEAVGAPLTELIADRTDAPRSVESENVALVKQWVDAFLAADLERILLLHHPEVIIELPGTEGLPRASGAGNWRGIDGARAHFRSLFSFFEPLEATDQEFDAAGALVFHRSTMSGRNRATGYVIASRYFNEFEIEEGLIKRRMTISDLTEHRRSFERE